MKSILINKNDFDIQLIDNEAIFQNKSNGTVHFLNEAALIIYDMLCEGETVEKIIKTFTEKYPDIDNNIIEMDCRNTIEDFINNSIIFVGAGEQYDEKCNSN